MQRYFTSKLDDNKFILESDDMYHIKTVMRMKTNDLIEVVYKSELYLCNLDEFDNIRSSGKIAITLREDDELISVRKTTGENEVIIGASNGRMVRFVENEIRIMGRTATGVKGIELGDSKVIGGEVITSDEQVLIVTEKGYGKKTPIEEYRLTHRGSKGVKALNVTEKNGMLVSLKAVNGDEDLVIITDSGIVMRMSMEQISTLGRATQGVRLIKLKDDQKVATVSTIIKEEDDEEVDIDNINESVENKTEVIEEKVENVSE